MSLFKNISLQEFGKGAWYTFLRFPLVLLSAVTGTLAAMVRVNISYDALAKYEYLDKLILVSVIGLILFFTLELLVVKYKLTLGKRALLWGFGLLFLVVYYMLLPSGLQEKQQIRAFLLVLALHLAASYVLFLNRREENAFWQFNKVLFLRILTSALYAAALYIGLLLAILAVDNLFEVEIKPERYGQLWLLLVGVFNTWFFLAGVPTNVQELEQHTQYPKGLKVFTQFVLLPLVTLYLVILYVYFGKIVLQWQWPQGWVSVLILCFSVAGILSLLLIHPIRHAAENTWIRTFGKWFYRALFPLIILLLLAIWRRVSEYGITEPRYFVLALALWLFCTALYFLLSSQKNIKFIPVTLSLLVLFTAFGPFNAFQVSEWSQVNRFKAALTRNNMFVNGGIVAATQQVSAKDEQEMSSILQYLSDMHGFESIKPWFKTDLDTILARNRDSLKVQRIYDQNKAALVMKEMGLEYKLYASSGEDHIYFNATLAEQNAVWDVSGYDYMADLNFSVDLSKKNKNESRFGQYKLNTDSLIVSYVPVKEQLIFRLGAGTEVLLLKPFYQKLLRSGSAEVPQDTLTVTLAGAGFAVKVQLQQLSLIRKKGDVTLANLNGRLFIRKKK